MSAARADSVPLIESIKPDDAFKISLSMKLNGEMVVVQGGKTSNLKLTASAEHRFRERVLAVQSSGPLPTKVARFYDDARAMINVDGSAIRALALRSPAHRRPTAERRTGLLFAGRIAHP